MSGPMGSEALGPFKASQSKLLDAPRKPKKYGRIAKLYMDETVPENQNHDNLMVKPHPRLFNRHS